VSSSGVTFSGISGIDTKSIVEQLMTIERRPLDRLEAKQQTYQARLSVFSELRTKLSSFRSTISALNTAREFQQFSISSTDTDDEHFTVSADSSTQATSHTVKVMQLATYEKEASQGFADVDDHIATGTFTITLGSGASQSVTIDETNNTLAGLRDAINNLDWGEDEDGEDNPGVKATVLNDGTAGTPYRLILSADESGTANTITVDTSGMAGTDPVPTFTETQAAVDAEVVFDGVTVTSSTNRIEDIVTGIDLDLKKVDTENEYTIDVSSNLEGIKESLQTFVEEYNGLVDYLEDKAGSDTTDRDASLKQILRQLKAITYTSVASDTGYSLLSQIGISNNREGHLEIDADELADALEDNFEGVVGLLTAYGTTENTAVTFLSANENTTNGTYAIDITGLGASLAGTIGGYATYAYGENTLVGADGTPVEGLSVYFSGQTTGNYGNITFTAGVFEQFDRLIDDYLDTVDGVIHTKEESINREMRYLAQRMERQELALEKTEARLTAQFTQMEIALSRMQNQNSVLAGMLS